jgi:hypothetical protein
MSAGEVLHPRKTHYSTTNCTNFHEWGAASPQILLAGFIRVHAGYLWFKDIRAGWAHGGGFAKSWTAKSFFLGIRLRASRLRRDIGGIVLACPIFQPRKRRLRGA